MNAEKPNIFFKEISADIHPNKKPDKFKKTCRAVLY
jgi:hypothetical protein